MFIEIKIADDTKWNDLQEFISDRALRGKNYSKKFKKAIHLTVERSKKRTIIIRMNNPEAGNGNL